MDRTTLIAGGRKDGFGLGSGVVCPGSVSWECESLGQTLLFVSPLILHGRCIPHWEPLVGARTWHSRCWHRGIAALRAPQYRDRGRFEAGSGRNDHRCGARWSLEAPLPLARSHARTPASKVPPTGAIPVASPLAAAAIAHLAHGP